MNDFSDEICPSWIEWPFPIVRHDHGDPVESWFFYANMVQSILGCAVDSKERRRGVRELRRAAKYVAGIRPCLS